MPEAMSIIAVPRIPQWQKDVPPEDVPFIKTIIERPDDDAPRLVYADHLEERGHTMAEFIRLQIKWFAVRRVVNCPRARPCSCARCRKAAEYRRDIRRMLKIRPGNVAGISGFDRGFVSRVSSDVMEWIQKGPRLIDRHPLVQWVRLRDLNIRRGIGARWEAFPPRFSNVNFPAAADQRQDQDRGRNADRGYGHRVGQGRSGETSIMSDQSRLVWRALRADGGDFMSTTSDDTIAKLRAMYGEGRSRHAAIETLLARVAELEEALAMCDTMMDSAAMQGVHSILMPSSRDMWANVAITVRAVLAKGRETS